MEYKMKLFFDALTKFTLGLVISVILVFLPAGTLVYTRGWLFIGLLFIPVFIMGIVLFTKAPNLLEKRLDAKEKEGAQKGVVAFSALAFLIGFIVAGLDFRFGWSCVSISVTIVASLIFLLSYALYTEVMRENAYLSRTVKVEENQRVVDTGLYKVVRHPMYTATIFLFLSIPLILGSWYSFIIFLPFPFILARRIKNEEALLTRELQGYKEYKEKVKYRLIPFIW